MPTKSKKVSPADLSQNGFPKPKKAKCFQCQTNFISNT